jgi:SAM-dependent methyltransferase
MHPDADLHIADIVDLPDKYTEDLSAKFSRFDATKSPYLYPSNHFDAVILAHVIEHLPDRGDLFNEIYRVLKPNGMLYVETPNLRRFLMPSPNLELEGREQIPINFRDDYTHVSLYTRASLVFLLRDYGFKIERHGIARNRLFFLLSPFMITLAYVFRNRRWLAEGLHSLIGSSCYCWAIKPTT